MRPETNTPSSRRPRIGHIRWRNARMRLWRWSPGSRARSLLSAAHEGYRLRVPEAVPGQSSMVWAEVLGGRAAGPGKGRSCSMPLKLRVWASIHRAPFRSASRDRPGSWCKEICRGVPRCLRCRRRLRCLRLTLFVIVKGCLLSALGSRVERSKHALIQTPATCERRPPVLYIQHSRLLDSRAMSWAHWFVGRSNESSVDTVEIHLQACKRLQASLHLNRELGPTRVYLTVFTLCRRTVTGLVRPGMLAEGDGNRTTGLESSPDPRVYMLITIGLHPGLKLCDRASCHQISSSIPSARFSESSSRCKVNMPPWIPLIKPYTCRCLVLGKVSISATPSS